MLNEIQQKLKAPKGQVNAFGKYKYRSCEDILEAVKPLLGDASLTLSDEIVEIGGNVYVKATARIFTKNNPSEIIKTTAYAREPEQKKGMDVSQITGAASSYARKYALNGLFCIDDTKDADTMDNRQQETKPSPMMMKAIMYLVGSKIIPDGADLDNLTASKASAILKEHHKILKENEGLWK